MLEIVKKDKFSKARVGSLKTEHGGIDTPSYVVVGTNAEIRCLNAADVPITKTQIVIANTYHLWRAASQKRGEPRLDFQSRRELDLLEDLHSKTKWNLPIMTDSGGFQVFSLGFAREHGVGKIASMFPDDKNGFGVEPEKNLVRITEDGAYFTENGEEIFLDAETSIKIQEKLGADIILAFDECTSPFNGYPYTKEALARTHRWAKRCLEVKSRNGQQIFGIVQGGAFRDLREESAKFIGCLPFDGFAIGGSLGRSRNEMFEVLRWTIPFLPETKPRHLLGIGRIKDLFEAVELGVDSFDCVVPTREARHGALWTRCGRFDILKGIYREDSEKIDDGCDCAVCDKWQIRRRDLHALFKSRDLNAPRFATIHNLYFFNDLMRKIRQSIVADKFLEFKKEFLSRLK